MKSRWKGIEFFVQTQQLIAGGRYPALRIKATLQTLAALADGGWIDQQVRDDLAAAYRFLRVVENRLQMVADEQTHTLPADRDGLERFARFAGFPDRDAFARALLVHLRNVQRHYATLFENAPVIEAGQRTLLFPLANPDAAVVAFDRFLAGLHGGGQLFSLLRQNPDLIALIALVLGTAPRLADGLAQFPEVMDAVIDPSFFGALPEETQLAAALDRSLGQAGSYEDFLDRIRIFAQEQMFLIGTRIVSGTVSAEQAGEAFARLRFRPSGIGRGAPALRRAVFFAADAAPDQRAHRADQSRLAL